MHSRPTAKNIFCCGAEFSGGSPFPVASCFSQGWENILSQSFHSLLDLCFSQDVLYYPLACVHVFFSYQKPLEFKKKKKMQRVFPGHESSARWKFRVSEGLAEVTDRAAAESGRLGFIGPDLSVRRGLQASA